MLKTRAYLYKWTEVSTGKIYVGSRTAKNCHPDDGYLCSSKVVKPLILDNPENWKREILCIGDPTYIRDLESKYLVSVDAAKNDQYYNQNNSDGKFSRAGIPHTQRQRDAHRKAGIANKGRKLGQKTPAQLEALRKVSVANKGRKATPTQLEGNRKGGLATKGMITAFNLITHETKRIPKAEFESNKGTLYVGHNHTLAKAWKESTI